MAFRTEWLCFIGFECDVHNKLFLGTELRPCPAAWFPPSGWGPVFKSCAAKA